jgi:hypothetical protein
MFAGNPDSILGFIEHEVEDEFNVETTLRDFKQLEAFVVKWGGPLIVLIRANLQLLHL